MKKSDENSENQKLNSNDNNGMILTFGKNSLFELQDKLGSGSFGKIFAAKRIRRIIKNNNKEKEKEIVQESDNNYAIKLEMIEEKKVQQLQFEYYIYNKALKWKYFDDKKKEIEMIE